MVEVNNKAIYTGGQVKGGTVRAGRPLYGEYPLQLKSNRRQAHHVRQRPQAAIIQGAIFRANPVRGDK